MSVLSNKKVWTKALLDRGIEYLRKADATSGEEFEALMEELEQFSKGYQDVPGFGLYTLDGDLLVACLSSQQAVRIQNLLLLQGILAQYSPGEHELTTYAHPETHPEQLVEYIVNGLEAPT